MATAATDAASSSSGSADSYIGSLISLTSKSEIRYEGVLFNINPEESSIGLRKVRSFGTEGRRKDGPQIPPNDKVYEYILFRGRDIKDLQVKSSPPVQTTTAVHNDPAIIKSHYPPMATASTSLPSPAISQIPDPTDQNFLLGQSGAPTIQGGSPLYQPTGSLTPWGSLPPSTTNIGAPIMPMYWQRCYGSLGGLQPHQQSLLQMPPGLAMPSSLQQTLPLPTQPSNSSSHLSENPPPLIPPFNADSSAVVSEMSNNLVADKGSAQTSSTLPFGSSASLATALDKNTAIPPAATDNVKIAAGLLLPQKSVPSESASLIMGPLTSLLNDGTMPSLVTPGQLLQPFRPAKIPLCETSESVQRDVEVVQVSPSETPSMPEPAAAPPAPANVSAPAPATELHEPIFPVSLSDRKLNRLPAYSHYGYRDGRDSGRGYGRRPATRFREDFDFTAMNDKFNKDEIWGSLGKSNKADEDGSGLEYEENVRLSTPENKPVYFKDNFFDTLSCDALDGQSRNRRPSFSEQMKKDTETFGDFSRQRGGRGGRGAFRGGHYSRGSYHGRRGYGYSGRGGRGYGSW